MSAVTEIKRVARTCGFQVRGFSQEDRGKAADRKGGGLRYQLFARCAAAGRSPRNQDNGITPRGSNAREDKAWDWGLGMTNYELVICDQSSESLANNPLLAHVVKTAMYAPPARDRIEACWNLATVSWRTHNQDRQTNFA